MTRDDLIDMITASLSSAGARFAGPPAGRRAVLGPIREFVGAAGPPVGAAPPPPLPGGDPAAEGVSFVAESASANGRKRRIFLSEYDIKKMLTPQSQLLKIPDEAILSPLASDWLILKGIKVIRG